MDDIGRFFQMLELRVPPLVLAVVFALAMGGIAWFTSVWSFAGSNAYVAGAVVWFLGCLVCLIGVVQFQGSSTTVNPTRPSLSTSLVTDGIYRFTRNPMYLGFGLMLAGEGVILGSILALILVPVYGAYITRFQILPEERILKVKFGDTYQRFLAEVPRWI
jgi:protein-S-isoprenylcysteine O-methyltransferase Ste14